MFEWHRLRRIAEISFHYPFSAKTSLTSSAVICRLLVFLFVKARWQTPLEGRQKNGNLRVFCTYTVMMIDDQKNCFKLKVRWTRVLQKPPEPLIRCSINGIYKGINFKDYVTLVYTSVLKLMKCARKNEFYEKIVCTGNLKCHYWYF